ncbi:hypothetical protein BDY19DRAFT_67926 [Irpex rosettiformis]|uniref:Uncharacterized protein n=1 Tax=Irpex rosettiformis TaxID=378272 RepID=A0ACB8ULI6_9APHY|nr:hypothetical protein BDY19DRAFT_67926 [Irpex rosettiformis]
MLFALVIPSLLLLASVNGAALPQRRATEVKARNFLDDIEGILSDALPAVESFIAGLVDPTDDLDTLLSQYPASTPHSSAPTSAFAIPGTPLQVGSSPTRIPGSLSLAGPFPSLAVVDPHNPSGIRLPGTPFMITAPAAVTTPSTSASVTSPTRRSSQEELEKRIDIDNIVNAVVSALPSAVQEKVGPLVHELIPAATSTGSSSGNPTSSPTEANKDAKTASVTTGPLHTPNAAPSLRDGPSFALTGSIVALGSIILGGIVAL